MYWTRPAAEAALRHISRPIRRTATRGVWAVGPTADYAPTSAGNPAREWIMTSGLPGSRSGG